ALDFVIFDDQQPLGTAQSAEGLVERALGDRLFQELHGMIAQRSFETFLAADDVNWNVLRHGILAQALKHNPTIDIRQVQIERNGARAIAAGQIEGILTAKRDHALEPTLVYGVQQDTREVRIILHDQDQRITRLNDTAVVTAGIDQVPQSIGAGD